MQGFWGMEFGAVRVLCLCAFRVLGAGFEWLWSVVFEDKGWGV